MNIRRFLVLLAAASLTAALFPPVAGAARPEDERPEAWQFSYEVRLGWGGYPVFDVTSMLMKGSSGIFSYYDDVGPYYGYGSLEMIYRPSTGPGYMTGVISAEFDFNFRKWFTLTVGLSGNGAFQDVFDVMSGAKAGRNRGVAMSLLPEARFNWLNRPLVRMYSSIGAGIGVTAYTKVGYGYPSFSWYPVFQVSPVGISVGRRVYWFAECGIGMQYMGGMTGIGVRF